MAPFTPIHALLRPLSRSSAVTISVLVSFETWLSNDRRISGFTGGSLTLPYSPPESSFSKLQLCRYLSMYTDNASQPTRSMSGLSVSQTLGSSIMIGTAVVTVSVLQDYSCWGIWAGDGPENPIHVDAVSAAINEATEVIARRSPSRAQIRPISDGEE